MAKRGRPRKEEPTVAVTIDYAKLLKQVEQEQQIQLELFYKQLALVKHYVNSSLTQVGFIDNCDTLSEAAFKAGRAYGPLDKANDKLEEMLENIYGNSDFNHWDDIIDEN
jgi:purine nucleoside permease